ncbi:hypothetical protein HU200_050567 [Digitaria exilis]|uniref:Peroxidase n=1 Tax=Digitaria exilis TaxID=1010633 RepID=A0A835EA81_9POAL|nr:hypothetical protein HU200_050567 [Digitaria exilis]
MASANAGRSSFLLLALLLCFSTAHGQLSETFYSSACPSLNLTGIVNRVLRSELSNGNQRMGASLLRLFFHDCFPQGCDASVLLGCDASILLDDTGSFTGEKTAFPNVNSVRGYEVIDQIKTNVEAACPGIVSCADIVALAARDGTFLLGGPTWNVSLGRRDSTTASWSQANSDLPNPASSLATLLAAFGNKGLNATDMTALSGAHTVGFTQCQFAKLRRSNCPRTKGVNDTVLAPLDVQTQVTFDNAYYGDLTKYKGLLHSDQELYNGGSQDALVKKYSSNSAAFFADFVAAMIKMGNISPLTGADGQIRANCRVVNN